MDVRWDRRVGNVTENQRRFEAPLAADWLDAIRKQVCPFCGEGPFTVVALHVARKHGISRRELRDMLGLYYDEPICDPDYSKSRSADMNRQIAEGRPKLRGGRPGQSKRLSTAARQKFSDRLKDPDFRAKMRDAQRAYWAERGGGTVNLECEVCGEQFKRYVSSAARYRRAFCSTDCSNRGKGVRARVLTDLMCETCGKQFERLARQHTSGRTFCSKACSGAAAGRRTIVENIRRHEVSVAQVQEVLDGASMEEVAEKHGITRSALAQAMKRQGIKPPDRRLVPHAEMVTFACGWCGNQNTRRAAVVRSQAKRNDAYGGPYCDNRCAALHRVSLQPAPTHCPAGHEYTPENTSYDKGKPKTKRCIACRRERDRAYHQRKKSAA